ncbi:ABC transporter substrate-binding protein [Cohnella algarum]|uniref:ABC transporter substrate-binding protein n=1 Tax=Cohnella algarum TaxID=2044859 RepID=UPI0019687433|nr:extracellular solute-binding protein [Cohnella algarum]MBN2980425.1 extracellular solute-binding protein [Cohnella algarum]
MPKSKAFGLLLATTLIAGLLAACGGGGSNAPETNASASAPPASASGSEPRESEPAKSVTISLLTDNTQDAVNSAKALIEAFHAKHPNITVEHETRPQGSEGDNFVKTRLATGDMNDVFFYNSGSLMQALNPEQNLLDLTNEPFQANVVDVFKPTVTFNGNIYGAPAGSTMGGGWFYNKKVYADLGLSVPKTWDELMANNDRIKAAGLTPIIGSYKETWTSQLIVLADYYNVQAQEPNFAADYTANKAKYATTPAALRSFEKLEQTVGYMNKDFLATTYDAGLKMLAEGKGVHYPMLTFAIPALLQNFPDQMDNIGFFAQPGDNADRNGLTVWMPGAAYIYKNGAHIEEAKTFVEFVASVEGMAAMATVSKPSGPYVIKGAELPEDTPQVVKDMIPYFDGNLTAPALEFVSPIKGPSLEQITVEVGSGQRSAKDAAEMYDKDVEKQAQQLGLEGW